MNKNDFISQVTACFNFRLTDDQDKCLNDVADYLLTTSNNKVHIINGYAGSGKTSLVAGIVKCLYANSIKTVLLAPTGRAAKVLAEYCKKPAFTIHKYIYNTFQDDFGSFKVILSKKQSPNTIYFIDESSMIADGTKVGENYYSERNLLEDILNFMFAKPNCKLIFVGDTAQLPPVGFNGSPALQVKTFTQQYHIDASISILTQVVRQIDTSPIIANATFIRNKILKKNYSRPFFNTLIKDTFFEINSYDFEDILNTCFNHRSDNNESIIICRSNKQSNMYNNALRSRILFYDSQLVGGEKLMVIKNNHFWTDEQNKESMFIANGEMIEIKHIGKIEQIYGFTFAHATIVLCDFPDTPSLDVILMLDTLNIETASLPYERKKELYNNILEDYIEIRNKTERNRIVRNNPYYNALQIKYGYAMTCHKAQGGQWDNIFIDKGFIKDENIDEEFFRWLYTAVTRGVKKIFLINFDDKSKK